MQVFTIGHGARTLDELVETLAESGVLRLVDVRRFPGSRRHPDFSRASLERALPAAGLEYEWAGEALGGRRRASRTSRHIAWRVEGFRGYADWMDGEVFRRALSALESEARTTRLAVMCAETLWWQCHRRMIADFLALHGFDVVHLLGPGKSQPHVINPQLRVDPEGRPVYDVGVTPQLFKS